VKTAIALVLMLALAGTAALAEPLPVPKPPGAGGSCPHGYIASGSFCIPSSGAADAVAKPSNGTCPWGVAPERELLLAQRRAANEVSAYTLTMKAKPPQLVAPRFLRDAEDYVESARQLAALPGGIRKWVSPIYQLLCHAIELTLKAYLAASGVPITRLANLIGHDLELAFRCAQKHGFTPSDARFWEVVQSLAPYHLDHSFRYGKPHGYVSHPEASKAAEIIGNTIKGAVEPYVRRQYDEINQGR
jgi:hypothetical protein